MAGPEDKAREHIDSLLEQAGWHVCDFKEINLADHPNTAVRNFSLERGHGFADYLLYVQAKAAGVIEAKKVGTTLTGVETQSAKYSEGLPAGLPAWRKPLPFAYESTGTETRFTNGLDPDSRSRAVFAFHRPDTLQSWMHDALKEPTDSDPEYLQHGKTFLERMRHIPPIQKEGLWAAQLAAIKNLEKSLAENRPRSLIQMATGSGKTFTAVSSIYRLIKFGGVKRVLFLVDRANLGRQTLREFKIYTSPYNNFKFTEEFIVQRLASSTIDTTARVCISTIQRLYSILRGKELEEEAEEESLFDHEDLFKEPPPVTYNPAIPIETFDVIVTDECHRSIYNLWRQVLEYFDASIIGLTATPNKQTFGFFNQNLVMEYGHEDAVADGVNVNYDVYRIKTAISGAGSKVDAGFYIDKRDRETREVRWERLDEALEYEARQLDREVVAQDQIRTIIRTFRDKLFTEIFPGRSEVPKTLIYAKDDSHADDIVQIVREEFGKGNEFAQKITYRTTGKKPEDLIAEFRNSYFPRVAVTVDMIATGTDIKPLEIVMFMRAVKSRSFFEQMKGRGVRIIENHDLKAVTPDADVKEHFIIVDAVGVCEGDKTDSRPMDQKKSVSLEKLLQAVALGNKEPDVLSSIAVRLARIAKKTEPDEADFIERCTGGKSLKTIAHDLVRAINPDYQREQTAKERPELEAPDPEHIAQTSERLIQEAIRPLHDSKLREAILQIKRKEQIIDTVSQDQVLEAGFSAAARTKARETIASFEQFISDHKDEITALQVLYNKPYRARLRFEDIKELADVIRRPPHHWTQDKLWQAYAALEHSKVHGASAPHILTDLVSLVRYATHQENELVPFPERVNVNFKAWLATQAGNGHAFTDEQLYWLEMIRDHIAANLCIENDDFDYVPFAQEGGLGRAHHIFGERFNALILDLNEALAA